MILNSCDPYDMNRTGRVKNQNKSIKQQINKLLLIVSAAMILITVLFMLMLIYINSQYEGALQCANTAAEFNKEFKSTIDMEMYNHVIQPRTDQSIYELPLGELDKAQDVISRLEDTTSLEDNKWRARSMLDMCSNLRNYMYEIARTDSYDQRMDLLERNIRGETGLTALIETYMHDFIDDEVRELSRLRDILSRQSMLLIISSLVFVILLSAVILWYSLRLSRQISDPIRSLSAKARKFGEDDFSGTPVETDITEIVTLDQNFDKMSERITSLMQKQKKDQQSLHRAELELLFAQINPHFLYNTLDSIAILAESEREEDVVTMVTSLSTFFRNSLSDGRDIIPLRAELAQATSYLEIQQIRYSDIMDYNVTVPEEMQDCMVPKLILQPLIENALYHGIKNRRGRGTINISGEKEGSVILLKVQDNGAGIQAVQLQELNAGIYQDNNAGLGLKNVSRRIKLYCGDEYGLRFESVSGEGTTVTVTLPAGGVTDIREEEVI